VNSDILTTEDWVSVLDRGLAYGDGLFETFRVKQGRPCLWQEHMERLQKGCNRLAIPLPDLQVLENEAIKLCSEVSDGVLKLILTRGAGGRGYRAPDAPVPWHGFSLHPAPRYPDSFKKDGVEARICQTRLGNNPVLAGIKHLNRLEQVLARNEWTDEFQEGLMLDVNANVIEGTMSNLFLITQQGLLTATLTECGIEGIMRGRILKWAEKKGIPCSLRCNIRLEDVFSADALFFTNSVIGIWPVRQLEDMCYSLNNETLQQLLSEEAKICAD
jgi:4-amino-4-deoxychorismate lyase